MGFDLGYNSDAASVPFWQDFRWRVRNKAFLLQELRELFPHVDDPELHEVTLVYFIGHLSMAWACYERGAAAAFLDVSAAFDQLQLTRPGSMTRETSTHHRAAARGEGGSAGAGGPLGKHRKSLIKRLRYEALRVALGLGRLDSIDSATDWGLLAAAESVLARRPFYAENVTADGFYRSCSEPRELREMFLQMALGQDGLSVTALPWPGKFYFPGRQTCRELGWHDVWQAFDDLGVESDDPILSIGHILPSP